MIDIRRQILKLAADNTLAPQEKFDVLSSIAQLCQERMQLLQLHYNEPHAETVDNESVTA